MEDESEAAQGQTTATGNAALSVTDVVVRPRSAPGYSGAACIRKEFRKGALQKEVDTSCPYKAAQPVYRHQHHTRKAFTALNQLRKDHLLCDVVLVADEQEIQAHKTVLSACSAYFSAMFTCELAESSSDRITLQEVDGNALAQLIDFVYTSEIQVTQDNVQTLLPAASLLQLVEVEEACCDFLQSQLHPSNSLGISAFADLHNCRELLLCSTQYTEQHFNQVITQDEFMHLTLPQLIKLISSDRLSVKNESQVYEAVLAWVRHEPRKRSQHFGQIMEFVRLPLVPLDYFVKVEEEELIKNDSRCKDYLIEALKYHLFKSNEGYSPIVTPRTKRRTPVGLPKVLLVLGGQAPKAIRSVELYDFKDERWNQVSEMLTRRCRCGVAVGNNLVYVCGGFNGSLRVRTVDVYDPVKDVWTSVQPMDARRSTLGAAVLDGMVYAVGGFDGSTGLNSVECYDPESNEWRTVCNMSTRRSSVGVGVVRDMLYAVGGYDGASRHCLASVECYDPKQDSWTPVVEMSCRRSGAGVCVVDGLLYAVGGHDGPLVRKSVEVYNPELNTWNQITDMHFCRRNAGVVANGGQLYVVGGDDGSTNLNSVECYDPKSNTWSLLPMSMATGRSYAGVAVVDKNC
ncbi:kelch-like protein 3 isoform X2 [Watersipora subatra]